MSTLGIRPRLGQVLSAPMPSDLPAQCDVNADDLYRLIRAKVTKKVFAEEVCVACRLVDKCKETYDRKMAAAVKALS